MKKGP
jgi:hypothetical protein